MVNNQQLQVVLAKNQSIDESGSTDCEKVKECVCNLIAKVHHDMMDIDAVKMMNAQKNAWLADMEHCIEADRQSKEWVHQDHPGEIVVLQQHAMNDKRRFE